MLWRVMGIMNKLISPYSGGDRRPVSYDIERTCPALLELDSNYPLLRRELESVLYGGPVIPRYHEVDSLQQSISAENDPARSWRTFMLHVIGHRIEANARRCPGTSALLTRIPNLVDAMFSILEPRKSIPAHCGPYQGILRYHLGLIVPHSNPPHIRVGDHIHVWKEGESFLFDDSLEHEVVNHSDGMRVVLIINVLRPLPWFLHLINARVVAWVSRSETAREIAAAAQAAGRRTA